MVYIAEFTIPPEAFPFGETLVEMPGVEIQVDQIIPTDESALPFFWVRGVDPEDFMEYAEREPEVCDTRELEEVDEVALFRAEWTPNAAVIEGLKQLDITIVETVGTKDHWRFEVRSQDRETFSEFQDIFEQEGIPITLHRLYDLDDLIEDGHRSLTPEQRETLLRAYQDGYFDTPRRITQGELGDHFGVSRRAISERLRRGTRNLIGASLLPEGNS